MSETFDNYNAYEDNKLSENINIIQSAKKDAIYNVLKRNYETLLRNGEYEEFLKVKTLFDNVTLPKRQTEDSAGYDICSYSGCVIPGNSHRLIDTGLSFTVPEGTYGQLMPRSSLSCKGLLVGAGVIDRDYTGNVKVLIHNLNSSDYEIHAGDRVAQLILKKISTPDVLEVESLQESERGEGGFGSTGV